MFKPKVLVWDLEFAGVGGIHANHGFIVCAGFRWAFSDKPKKVISILDYPNGENWRTADHKLLPAIHEKMCEADLNVAHYGDHCDKPYLTTRLISARLDPLPETRQLDTWKFCKYNLLLSNNRMATMAKFLNVKTQKMVHNGWPDWWFGALRFHAPSIRKMVKYNGIDVDCLTECIETAWPYIPQRYLISVTEGESQIKCRGCGGRVRFYPGEYHTPTKSYRRYQCTRCGRFGHKSKAVDSAP